MFSRAVLSLAAGKMRKNIFVMGGFRYDVTESQAASCKHFQCQNRRFQVFEAGYYAEGFSKIVSNFKRTS
jgi:hypothetical protein